MPSRQLSHRRVRCESNSKTFGSAPCWPMSTRHAVYCVSLKMATLHADICWMIGWERSCLCALLEIFNRKSLIVKLDIHIFSLWAFERQVTGAFSKHPWFVAVPSTKAKRWSHNQDLVLDLDNIVLVHHRRKQTVQIQEIPIRISDYLSSPT